MLHFPEEAEKLIERIQTEGLGRLSVYDFSPALESLDRKFLREWVDDIDDLYGWASTKMQLKHNALRHEHTRKVFALARAIEERDPNNPNAKTLAAAIRRLTSEITEPIGDAITRLYHGKGKPATPRDIISDERHGTLCDAVENAILALVTQADNVGQTSATKTPSTDNADGATNGDEQSSMTVEEAKQNQIVEAHQKYKDAGSTNKRKAAREVIDDPKWKGRGYSAACSDKDRAIDALRKQI